MDRPYPINHCCFGVDNKQDEMCHRKSVGTAYWPDHTYPTRVCRQHGESVARSRGYIIEWDADRAKS
jgi:hypothetical protein